MRISSLCALVALASPFFSDVVLADGTSYERSKVHVPLECPNDGPSVYVADAKMLKKGRIVLPPEYGIKYLDYRHQTGPNGKNYDELCVVMRRLRTDKCPAIPAGYILSSGESRIHVVIYEDAALTKRERAEMDNTSR